ncbi:hypothetical protein FQA39_LY03599 [Lamprigera yunnana]|nr:hypothetical protein FQA39_LY03599 [Lamprigera yunnana]
MDVLCVDVVIKDKFLCTKNAVLNCTNFLQSNFIRPNTIISKFGDNKWLTNYVEYIIIGEQNAFENKLVEFSQLRIKWFVYTVDKNGEHMEIHCDGDDETVQLAVVRLLPSEEYIRLWESLIYESNIKENLLNYAKTSILYSEKGVDCNIINCNRVVLLYGPPGTGKTSLCKALAQKLSVRLRPQYERSFLFEINSHSLFSKWFSESGKLVTKMFGRIIELLQDPGLLIFVLIDEIESLTHARQKSMSGGDPSDSMRVVNAVLTQLDQIRKHPNVFILSTSNITGAIDIAFIDRADIKQFIGLPGAEGIYKIYHSCIEELQKAKIISSTDDLLHNYYSSREHKEEGDVMVISNSLYEISKLSVGLSGRRLRKIPFLAHALFLDSDSVDIKTFISAMKQAIVYSQEDSKNFNE